MELWKGASNMWNYEKEHQTCGIMKRSIKHVELWKGVANMRNYEKE